MQWTRIPPMNWCPLLKNLKRAEIRKVLLAHVNTDITTHCSAGELKALLEAVERLVKSDKLPPETPLKRWKVLQFPYSGSKESSRKVAE